MSPSTVRQAQARAVREQVLEGVADLLAAGDDLTFARIARAAGVPERTVYRHFGSRQALLAAVFAWSNDRLGFDGQHPTTGEEAAQLARRVFPGFDTMAPVVHELLVAPEGRAARLEGADDRRAAAVALVRHEAPELDDLTTRRTAAAVLLLTSAATWQTLRDYWEVDGAEAGETAALAIELLLDGARARADRSTPRS